MIGKMTEEEFQQQVIEYAHLKGWLVAHFRKARTKNGWITPVQADGKGFPDLILIRPNRLVVAELKRAGAKPTPEQRIWLEAFQNTRKAESYWWQAGDDEDWAEIEKVLA